MASDVTHSEHELLSELRISMRTYRKFLFLKLSLCHDIAIGGEGRSFADLDQRLNDAYDEVEHCLSRSARVSCTRLCNLLQERLPLELRNMIYGYISTREQIIILNGKAPVEQAHYWVEDFVGATTLSELVGNYYNTSPLTFQPDLRGSQRYHERVYEVLSHDFWGLGLQPFKHISDVTYVSTPGTFQRSAEVKKSHLKSLYMLKSGTKITIVLTAWLPTSCSWLLPGGMDTFKDIILSYHAIAANFKRSGYRVTIKFAKWPLDGTKATVLFRPHEDYSWATWNKKANGYHGEESNGVIAEFGDPIPAAAQSTITKDVHLGETDLQPCD